MATAADQLGPTWVSEHSSLWGYDPKRPVRKQTVNTWQHQLAHGTLNADAEHARHHNPTTREVPVEVRAAVKRDLEHDVSECGETTTDVVSDMFVAHGRPVSASFLGTFRQETGYSLHRQAVRAAAEVEHEGEIEREILELWEWIKTRRERGLKLLNMVIFDEKPVSDFIGLSGERKTLGQRP